MGAWVLLTSRPLWQAELLAGALEAEGVAVRLERNGLGSIYGQFTFSARLLVAPEDAERARTLLWELESSQA